MHTRIGPGCSSGCGNRPPRHRFVNGRDRVRFLLHRLLKFSWLFHMIQNVNRPNIQGFFRPRDSNTHIPCRFEMRIHTRAQVDSVDSLTGTTLQRLNRICGVQYIDDPIHCRSPSILYFVSANSLVLCIFSRFLVSLSESFLVNCQPILSPIHRLFLGKKSIDGKTWFYTKQQEIG
ncbi:hypothetical protein DPEC_G00278670 [Dallia pectoralis]|uniref:Uncharacterized protein n=1 Tax=Dallia pectoralis TaxID=75939 RepID=A0ACC2FM33_DALPE|nr:hypothetical protein DPEC_G00278670 [Dallia pectoralis]